ncbi:hypothetical protein COLO4_04242 [Corchorus olitorius]|uniref:Uncharacterized protein n=1 Tax=Corchorus olitorius TaxID=93759 RepID=A0A1R3KUP9_9ROSI|nr:hypothetical protein COLO4_04242 [Corchorus olitorius]
MAHKDTAKRSYSVSSKFDDNLSALKKEFKDEFKGEILTEMQQMFEPVLAKRDLAAKGIVESLISSKVSPANNSTPPPCWPPQVPPWPIGNTRWIYPSLMEKTLEGGFSNFNNTLRHNEFLKIQRSGHHVRLGGRCSKMASVSSQHQWRSNHHAMDNICEQSAMRERYASEAFFDPLAELVALKHTGGYKMVVADNLNNSSDVAIKKVEELATGFGRNLSFHQIR